MGLIKSFREKHRTRQIRDINLAAEEFITLVDFDGNIFISFHNVPLVPVDASWTQKEILCELSKIRNNYVNAKIKELC